MKKFLATLSLVVLFGCSPANLIGGGGSQLKAPDTIKTGEPTNISYIVTATGGGGPILGRFRNITFHYRLKGESEYRVVQAQPVVLPENFKNVQSKTFQSEAYIFTIPPYPVGTIGEVEYYSEVTFDGQASHAEGKSTIKVSDEAKSSHDLQNNLSVINICGKNFKIDRVTLEDRKLTERIAGLIDEELRNKPNDETILCYSLHQLPEYSELKSGIADYDPKNGQYLVLLHVPFVVDLKKNIIYKVQADQHSLGEVLGNLQ